MSQADIFKSGFIALTGLPNAGKSTLLNRLAGGRLSAVSPKPQTTRQNIIAISNGKSHQAVFVDTPGFLRPSYGLQRTMLHSVRIALREDADIICLVAEPCPPQAQDIELAESIRKLNKPVFLAINKIDKNPRSPEAVVSDYRKLCDFKSYFMISALTAGGVEELKTALTAALPEHPPYFPPGQWTDRWERFFAAELIREQIFLLYRQELPYSCAVEIETFRETPPRHIRAIVHVERESQRPILLGHGGSGIKKLRESAEAEINRFLGGKTRLELFVKITAGWRDNAAALKKFGYSQ